ncbi:hypothetical protein GGE66_004841 [Rhizobium leguminosarum]|uniref:Uncharacterized protein n=1 Tax=Rhizobium leguminosarum TaxID=384 RepID=A0A7W9ZWP7_RHILE|nr:hypothetical protein [Rhizobium leguminosarum]
MELGMLALISIIPGIENPYSLAAFALALVVIVGSHIRRK